MPGSKGLMPKTAVPENVRTETPARPAGFAATIAAGYLWTAISQACDVGFYFLLFTFLPLPDVGQFSWVIAVMAFVGLLVDLGISPALVREFAQDNTGFSQKFRAVLKVRVRTSGVCVAAFGVWWVALKPDPGLAVAVILAGLGQLVRAATGVFAAWLRGVEQQPLASSISGVSSVGRLAVAAALFRMEMVVPVADLFAGLLLVDGLALGAAWAAWVRLKDRVPRTAPLGLSCLPQHGETAFEKRLRSAGWTFLGISGLTVLQNRLDWLMLAYFWSDRVLAPYALANKCYEAVQLLGGISLVAIYPRLARTNGKVKGALPFFLKLVLVGGGLVGLGGALLGPEILRVLWGSKYAVGDATIRILMLASIPAVFAGISYYVLVARGAERFVLLATILTTALQAGLNVALVPSLGTAGAVAGMIALVTSVSVVYACKAWSESRRLGLELAAYAATLGVSGALLLLTVPAVLARVALGLAVWMLGSLVLLGPTGKGDLQMALEKAWPRE